jgi:hypothetical protein
METITEKPMPANLVNMKTFSDCRGNGAPLEALAREATMQESGNQGGEETRRGQVDARETETGIPGAFDVNRHPIERPRHRIGVGKQIALESEKLPGFSGVTGVAE